MCNVFHDFKILKDNDSAHCCWFNSNPSPFFLFFFFPQKICITMMQQYKTLKISFCTQNQLFATIFQTRLVVTMPVQWLQPGDPNQSWSRLANSRNQEAQKNASRNYLVFATSASCKQLVLQSDLVTQHLGNQSACDFRFRYDRWYP